jgi:hypothetical protein
MENTIENKLEELRRKWRATTDPVMRGIIERQAKVLKRVLENQKKEEDPYEIAKKVFNK